MTAVAADGFCVEFLGLPGAGKSAVSQVVADLLRQQGWSVSEPTHVVARASPVAARRGLKLWYALQSGMRHPRDGSVWIRTLLRDGQQRLAESFALIVNWFYLLEVSRRRATVPGVHLFDQGLLQALWSVGYDAKRRGIIPAHLVAGLDATLPPRVLVVIVEAAPATVRRRLCERSVQESRLERDLVGDHADAAFARAATALEQVEAGAIRLMRANRIRLVRVDNTEAGSLVRNATTVVRAIDGM